MVRFIKILACATTCLFAQTSLAQGPQIATLLSNGKITNYYSSTGFIEAYNNSQEGDVITLSSGIFNATDIKKNITVRGSSMGMSADGSNTIPTTLSGHFNIDLPESDTHCLTLEGLTNNETVNVINAPNMSVSKCQLGKMFSNGGLFNCTILHCILKEISDRSKSSSLTLLNSAVTKEFDMGSGTTHGRQITNCVIYGGAGVSYSQINNSVYVLVKGSAYQTSVDPTCSVNNSIIINCDQYKANNGGNRFLPGDGGVFVDGTNYELTDEFKSFTGTDGTTIGIHGGSMPFTPELNVPRITRFKVSPKTSADGKLSLDIEIKGVE